MNPAIRVHNLGKRYRISHEGNAHDKYKTLRDSVMDLAKAPFRRLKNRGEEGRQEDFWALKDVSFDVQPGEVVGIIGRNGAGKSTLLKILSRITKPSTGSVQLNGRVGSLLEVGTGFHPELTGRENIFLNGSILGMKRAEIQKQFDAIVDFSGVEKFLDTPVKRYSSGMYVRLAFAVAAHLTPEILIIDEVLAVGDVSFQKKCLGKLEEVGAAGRAVLFVSHSVPAILRLCNRVMLFNQGSFVTAGRPHDVVREYLGAGADTIPSERIWIEKVKAPGDKVAKLHAVRVLDGSGTVCEFIDIEKGGSIQIEYWNEQNALKPSACFHLLNDTGIVVFAGAEFTTESWQRTPIKSGLVQATCRIPPFLLAEGRYSVLAAVCTFDPNAVHAIERDAITFQAVEPHASHVRQFFGGAWPGEVRPRLEWSVHIAPSQQF